MQANGQRFCQGSFREAQMRANRVRLVAFNDELLSKSALNVGEGHRTAKEAHVQAMVLLAHLAETASAAGA